MGPLGMGEIIVLFVLALLIFGPKKLPELGKTFGKGMAEFKRASNELKSTFQREMDNIERETKDVKDVARDVSKDLNTSYYEDNEDDYYSDYDYDGASSTAAAPAKASDGQEPSGTDAAESIAGDGEQEMIEKAATSGDDELSPAESAADTPVSGVPETEETTVSKTD